MLSTTTPLGRSDVLAEMAERRKRKGYSLADLGEKLGKSSVFVGAVFSGQAMLAPETAAKLAVALDMRADDLAVLTEPPVRNSDPFVYRLHEMVEVYGESLRTLTNEQFGDGILSAIDLKISFERRGERAVIVLDSKFLPYKEF